jgi:hypothetical protein
MSTLPPPEEGFKEFEQLVLAYSEACKDKDDERVHRLKAKIQEFIESHQPSQVIAIMERCLSSFSHSFTYHYNQQVDTRTHRNLLSHSISDAEYARNIFRWLPFVRNNFDREVEEYTRQQKAVQQEIDWHESEMNKYSDARYALLRLAFSIRPSSNS